MIKKIKGGDAPYYTRNATQKNTQGSDANDRV